MGAVGFGGAPGSFDRYEIPRDPEAQRRARLLDSTLVEPPRLGPAPPAGLPPTVLAFTRSAVGGGLPSAGKHPTYQLALLQQSLRLEPPAGPFTVPAGVTPPEVSSQSTRGLGFGSNNVAAWLELQSGAVTYTFRPPLPARFHADALVIATRQVGPSAPAAQGRGGAVPPTALPGPAEPGTFAVYNWQSAAWEPLGGQEHVRLEPATPYLGPDGAVKVQVSAAPDRLVRFVQPELTVEGTVA